MTMQHFAGGWIAAVALWAIICSARRAGERGMEPGSIVMLVLGAASGGLAALALA